MDAHAHQAQDFFDPALVAVPQAVTVFSALRQGEYHVNELNYPELTCCLHLPAEERSGEVASKLTAAMSIHVDGFLGLSCSEPQACDEGILFSARFSNLMTGDDVERSISTYAADIIDTLMALN